MKHSRAKQSLIFEVRSFGEKTSEFWVIPFSRQRPASGPLAGGPKCHAFR